MQLIGQAIRHQTFGKGVVTGCEDNILTVCFSAGDKRFIYPDAFAGHLTLKNSDMQSKIQGLLSARAVEKKQEQQAAQKEQECKRLLRNLKISSNSQAAFNIPPAQEEALFSAWSVSTGTCLSGFSKGEPRIPDRLKPNSLCLLTQCAAKAPEQERRIIGAFMVQSDFFGIQCQSGTINAHPAYRIALAPESRPAFWPYLTEEHAKQRWGNTVLKYFSNRSAEKILFDIRELQSTPEEKSEADQFYRYFCRINRLPPRECRKDIACG